VKLAVLTAAAGAAWESHWIGAFERLDLSVAVSRRCVDVVELLAVAAAGQGRVALVSAALRHFDADAVARLIAAGVAPVGVVQRDDATATSRLRALGVAHIVPADAEPEVVASVLAAATSGVAADEVESARTFGDPAMSLAAAVPAPGTRNLSEPARRGSLIAVWGPTGGPGRTTVAILVADELARHGCDTVLIDADAYGATIAATLGLLDESSGLAAACRHASSGPLEPHVLAGLCWQLGPRLRLLTGITLPARWPELRPAALATIFGVARTLGEFTIIDCGFCLEADEELSFDTLAPRRNAATLAALDAADLILVVGAADPVGIQRLIRALAELRDVGVDTPSWVVLNKVRHDVAPGDTAAELTAALERFASRTPAGLLPYDRAGLDAALIAGRALGDVVASSPLRRAAVELAAALAGVPDASRRRAGNRRGWRGRDGSPGGPGSANSVRLHRRGRHR
jgi:MinD-like ATPase involved in chromosome partitioning or flagellar assembly